MHLRLCMPCRIKWRILVMKYKEYWPILSVHNGTIMQAQWPINRRALHLLFGRHPRPKTYSQAAVTKSLDEIFAYNSRILWISRIKRVLYRKKCCLFWFNGLVPTEPNRTEPMNTPGCAWTHWSVVRFCAHLRILRSSCFYSAYQSVHVQLRFKTLVFTNYYRVFF